VVSFKTNEENAFLAWQLKGSDTLALRNLSTGKERSFSGITEYNFDNKGGWLVCQSNTQELRLYNPATSEEKRFSNVAAYVFSANGKALLLNANNSLQYLDLAQAAPKTVYTAKQKSTITGYSLDEQGRQVLFTIVDSADAGKTGIWYYSPATDNAVLKINNRTPGVPEGFIIGEPSFTDNGNYIQFSLQEQALATTKPADDRAGVEVWDSKDLNLQSVQAKQLNKVASYHAIVNKETGKIVLVENVNRKIVLQKGDFALVKTDYKQKVGDRFWESGLYKDNTWIVSLRDGSSRLLPAKLEYSVWFSPDGNYLVYFDEKKASHYHSYNLHTGELKNISATVADNQLGIKGGLQDGNEDVSKMGSLAAWIDGEEAVLVYDNYDIWKLDLTGKQAAINITSGFGQAANTVLNLFSTGRGSGDVPVLKTNTSLLLRAFNWKTKQYGFYKKANLSSGVPTQLYMGGYFMKSIEFINDPNLSNDGMAPVKAANSGAWIVQRQSDTDAPNYYSTTDFKNFKRLTNYQPQVQYKWMTQELVSFKHLDGTEGQGILYKPEDFDASKKYPVIIVFYGGFSNNMYQYRIPNYMDGAIAIGESPAWFVSNGYLVFTPDIAVAPLRYGPKAYSCIEGAAQYLKNLPYVDGNKLGTTSHSWSAKLGAYIFTHSNSISATSISEGHSYANVVNMALTSKEEGKSELDGVENGFQFGNLWENKDRWLDQTTVLNVDKAVSPLLLFCNKESSESYQDQTFQFFTALRRLDKKAWWLKYDNGSHTLRDVKEQRDYTIRYTQFFDHYLKYAPAPQWMTQGIPYKLKGIESRYELDPQGKCNSTHGEPCLICAAWNAQYKKTPAMFQKEIKDWSLDKDIADELERKINERRKVLDKEGEIQTKQVLKMLNDK
jgi:hypothetical protein